MQIFDYTKVVGGQNIHYRVWCKKYSLSKLKLKMNSEDLVVIGMYDSYIESVIQVSSRTWYGLEVFEQPSYFVLS